MEPLDARWPEPDAPALPELPALLARIEEIDQAVQQAASRLQAAPHTLPKVAPALRALAAERRRCLRPLLAAWASLPAHALGQLATLWAEATREPGAAGAPCAATAPAAPCADEPQPAQAMPEAAAEPCWAAGEGDATEDSVRPADAPTPQVPGAALSVVSEVALPAVSEPVLPVVNEAAVRAVSARQLVDFAARFRAKKTSAGAPAPARDALLLQRESLVREVLRELGPLPGSMRELTAAIWLDRLERLSSEEWLRSWGVLDKALQVDLLSLLVALTRAAQEKPPVDQDAIARVLFRLSAFSKREQPGFTHGLARKHTPRGAGWLDDARQAEKALRSWLGEAPPTAAVHLASSGTPAAFASPAARLPLVALSTSGEPTASATALVPAGEPTMEEAPESEEAPPLVEDDWAFWSVVRGKRAVMFGGSPREPYRQRLLEVFGFASLDWVDGHVRRVDSLAERLAHARVDLVLVVIPFLSHKSSSKVIGACKRYSVPYALLEHGHGVLAVRRAIERFCAPRLGALVVPA